MDQILRLKTKPEIEAQLENFPTDLNEAYVTIFEKIDKLDGFQPAIAKRAFQWLLASPSGEIETEVLHAAVWQDYESDENDIDNDGGDDDDCYLSRLQIPPAEGDVDYILDACQHLIEDDSGWFTWSHISVREYLLDHKEAWVEGAPVMVGSVCLLALMDSSSGQIEDEEAYYEETSLRSLRRYSQLDYGIYLKTLDTAEAGSPPRKLLSHFLGLSSPLQPSPFSLLKAYRPFRWKDSAAESSFSEPSLSNSPLATYQPSEVGPPASGEHPIWAVCHYGLESSFDELCRVGSNHALLYRFSATRILDETSTLVGMAIIGQSWKIVEALLKLGIKPTEDDIISAVNHGQILYFELLDKYSGGLDCVSFAIVYLEGRLDARQAKAFHLVLEFGKESRGTEWFEWHLLRQKILQDDKDGVSALLRKGVNPNYIDPKHLNYTTPLTLAVIHWTNLMIIQMLLDHNADPNGCEHSRPLFHACDRVREDLDDFADEQKLDVVKLLLDHGADPNKMQVKYQMMYGALYRALMFDRVSPLLLKLLLERGADPNGIVKNGPLQAVETILSSAIRLRSTLDEDILQFLVDNGALVNGQGETSGLPLKAALLCDKLSFLQKNGADIAQIRREWVDEAIGRELKKGNQYRASNVLERLRFVRGERRTRH